MEFLLIFACFVFLALFLEWLLRQLKINNYESRYVLITGCDTGFGNATAKKLEKSGFYVFACCLTKSAVANFNAMSSPRLKAIEMDVTKDASIEKALEIVKRALPENKGLWAVINNAGVIGGLWSINLHTRQDYENTLAVNLFGVIMVTKACMPLVLKEKGRFVNTSSLAGRIALVNSSYAISKYGIEAFSDVLRRELYRTGVKVQIIEPGGFNTPIFDRERIRRLVKSKIESLPAEVKSQLPDGAADQVASDFSQMGEAAQNNINPVVDAYFHAVTAKFPKKRYVVGIDINYIFRTLWMLPEWLSDFYLDLIIKKPL